MTWRRSSILLVWVCVVAGIVLVAVTAQPSTDYRWLGIVLVAALLLTFALQLALPTTEGLVVRILASVGGSVVLLGLATGILAVLRR